MLLRALVVLLVILNFGVAAWWALRGEPGDAVQPDVAGMATLRLVGEADALDTAPAVEPVVESADAEPGYASAPVAVLQPGDPPQCVALGPFADAATRDAARARLTEVAVTTRAREVGETPRGWRVWRAPLPDRAATDAEVARLVAAGFNDYYVIADGAEANGIALGRFGSEASARARAQALRASGFEADVQPLGSLLVRYWIDAMLADGGSGEDLRAQAGAARSETGDCDALAVAG